MPAPMGKIRHVEFSAPQAAEDEPLAPNPGLAEYSTPEARRSAYCVHYVSMSDSSREARENWIIRCQPKLRVLSFPMTGTAAISRAHAHFDVLLVGGNDLPRLTRYVRDNAAAVRTLPKIALVDNLHAAKRAKLLYAGFDDVFDVSRLAVEEGVARICAMHERYQIAQRAIEEPARKYKTLAQIAHIARLTDREKMILTELINAPNKFCSYSHLSHLSSDWGIGISHNNLKVIISNLRLKLKHGVKITSRMNEGYEIKI